MFKNLHKFKYNKGVTLIELLVVISIFMVISSITIFSYGKFNSSLSIQNLSDDIALSVRRAQGFAIGVRGYSGSFGDGYGIHFTANPSSNLYAGSSKSFILFADINLDNKYSNSSNTCGSPTASDECLELLSITSADRISDVYIDGGTNPIATNSTVDIVFKRPNPEPTFCYRVGGSGSCSVTPISNVKIKILNNVDANVFKIITVSNNGQISVSG